jgi:hypothetical protein
MSYYGQQLSNRVKLRTSSVLSLMLLKCGALILGQSCPFGRQQQHHAFGNRILDENGQFGSQAFVARWLRYFCEICLKV